MEKHPAVTACDNAESTDEGVKYISVGIPIGPRYDGTNTVFGVRCGTTFCDLDANESSIWSVGLDAPNLHELLERTTAVSPADFQRSIARLAQIGLLCHINDSEESNHRFLRSHQLLGIGFGLGQTNKNPPLFGIGGTDLTLLVTADLAIYTIWIGVGDNASMWEACEAVSETVGVSVNSVAAHLLEALPTLMRESVALVDLATQEATTAKEQLR